MKRWFLTVGHLEVVDDVVWIRKAHGREKLADAIRLLNGAHVDIELKETSPPKN